MTRGMAASKGKGKIGNRFSLSTMFAVSVYFLSLWERIEVKALTLTLSRER
jgi:hypothetical protein